jgi:hypothetical protein
MRRAFTPPAASKALKIGMESRGTLCHTYE